VTAVRENLTRDEARTRAALVEDVRYEVLLDLTRGDETFRCETRVLFRAAEPGATTFIDLTAHDVHEVVLNGRDIDATDVRATRVTLTDLAADNELRIVADMAYRHTGKGLHFFRDPTDDAVYLHSQFEPFDAHLVYPCFDQPDLKAVFDLSVDAPAGWVVVSNERCTEQPAEGAAGRWRFAPTPRLSTYVTAVVAGQYAAHHTTHGDVDLGFYVRASLLEHLEVAELAELTRQGLDWFDANFGIAYPFGKYDQLFVPEFSAGAMENPGCITFSESYVFRSRVTDAQRERRAETVLHEMAHMWFGDLVTMRWWDDLWLNESFATFCAVLSQVEATRFTKGWVTFLDSEKAWAKYQDQLPTTHPIAADLVDVEAVHQNFDGITYAKGASVLRQLVAYVGQEAFLAGCRAYFQAHQYGNAELADFLTALEEASGRDLSEWTRAWLSTSGINTLAADHAVADDGTFARFAVVQSADAAHPTLRPHRLAIGVYDWEATRLVRTHRVEVDVAGERTEVPALVGVDAGAMVLVNDDDLTFTKLRLDDRTMDVATSHLAALADPLPRALVWAAAWDMVRDGELPATQFVDLAIANSGAETEVGVTQRLAARSLGAAVRYAAPDHRDDLRRRLADHALAQLEQAEPGSGHQLVWARLLASAAHTDDQLERVAQLLDGSWDVPGLDVDTELRWHLVTALAREGAAGVDRIDRELERDQTDIGERHAITARAAMPDPEQKAAAWRRLTEDTSLSHTLSRQIWGGFQQMTQPKLLAEYGERYFDVLDDVWRDRDLEWAIEFSSDMFPLPCASEEVAARTAAVLERPDLPGPLRRVLLEEQDLLQRVLTARARDA
jgi:aminopeptidase N